MQINFNKKSLYILFALSFVFCARYADATHERNNHNPASIAYVNTAIEIALQTVTYRAGEGIRIDQPGNFIVATGATEAYVGIGAINITDANVSARFSGTNGLYVPVNEDGDNTGTIEGYQEGNGIAITSSTSAAGSISVTPYVSVGDVYQGGVVFYVDATGQHGLSVAIRDGRGEVPYFLVPQDLKANGSAIGSGAVNTTILLSKIDTDDIIAAEEGFLWAAFESGQQCIGYANIVPCFGGFYLGAAGEWGLLIVNLSQINQVLAALPAELNAEVIDGTYWSSTEYNDSDAVAIQTGGGSPFLEEDKTTPHKVRAIRLF